MEKQIVLFDIDKTIFDTNKLKTELQSKMLEIIKPTNLQILNDLLASYTKTLKNSSEFEPEDYIRFVAENLKLKNHKNLLDVFYGKENIYKDCLFPGVRLVFNKLKDRYKLGIFSEGTLKFQNHKFKSLEINKYLDKNLIYIFKEKTNKEALVKIPKHCVVVDDKKSVVEFLTKNNIRAIWLNRISSNVHGKFETVFSLKDVAAALERLQ